MRRGILELCLIIVAVIGIHAERLLHNGSIEGRISPSTHSPPVTAVRGGDSVRVISNEGHFGMELQPGEWKVIIGSGDSGIPPTEKNIQVMEGKRLDLGEIRISR